MNHHTDGSSGIVGFTVPQSIHDRTQQAAVVHIHDDLYLDAGVFDSAQVVSSGLMHFVHVEWSKTDYEVGDQDFRCVTLEAAQQLAREIVQRVNQGRGVSLAQQPLSDADLKRISEEILNMPIVSGITAATFPQFDGAAAIIGQLEAFQGIEPRTLCGKSREKIVAKLKAEVITLQDALTVSQREFIEGYAKQSGKAFDEIITAGEVHRCNCEEAQCTGIRIETRYSLPKNETPAQCTCPTSQLMTAGCDCGALPKE